MLQPTTLITGLVEEVMMTFVILVQLYTVKVRVVVHLGIVGVLRHKGLQTCLNLLHGVVGEGGRQAVHDDNLWTFCSSPL